METHFTERTLDRLASRFRLAAHWIENRGYMRCETSHGIDPLELALLHSLASSTFPEKLRQVGRAIRFKSYITRYSGWQRLGDVYLEDGYGPLCAADEYRYVDREMRECIDTSDIPLECKKVSIGQLDRLNDLLTRMFSHDEATLVYREVRTRWKNLQPFQASVYSEDFVYEELLVRNIQMRPVSALEAIVARLVHADFQDIPKLCAFCPRNSSIGHRYCNFHNPMNSIKSGYERGRRVNGYITNKDELRDKVKKVRGYRAIFSEYLSRYETNADHWTCLFLAHLNQKLREGLVDKSTIETLKLPKTRPTRAKIMKALSGNIEDDDPRILYPKYIASRVIEFAVLSEIDNQLRKWDRTPIDALMLCVEKHEGSIKSAAYELGMKPGTLRMKICRYRKSKLSKPLTAD